MSGLLPLQVITLTVFGTLPALNYVTLTCPAESRTLWCQSANISLSSDISSSVYYCFVPLLILISLSVLEFLLHPSPFTLLWFFLYHITTIHHPLSDCGFKLGFKSLINFLAGSSHSLFFFVFQPLHFKWLSTKFKNARGPH